MRQKPKGGHRHLGSTFSRDYESQWVIARMTVYVCVYETLPWLVHCPIRPRFYFL